MLLHLNSVMREAIRNQQAGVGTASRKTRLHAYVGFVGFQTEGMFFLMWSGPASVLFIIPIRVWDGSRRKVQLRRCGLKTVRRSCKGLPFGGRNQAVPELPVSCVCFTQVKPHSYVGALWTKQVPCRKQTQCFGARIRDLSGYGQGNLPLLATGAVAFLPTPTPNTPHPLLSMGVEQGRHPSPSTLCFEVPQPHAHPCLPVVGDSWEGLLSPNKEASFLLAGLLLLLWQLQLDMEHPAQLQTLRHCFRTRPVRRNEAFWW